MSKVPSFYYISLNDDTVQMSNIKVLCTYEMVIRILVLLKEKEKSQVWNVVATKTLSVP